MNFVKLALENGGSIKPLLISSKDLSGPSLTNPSVIVVDGKILVNVRNVNYTLYHSELGRFEHAWGPLVYVHPENDSHLRTTNYILQLDDNLDPIWYSKIDTSDFDTYQPQWDFVGLEDARLVRWNDKLFMCGVRRDTKTNGEGRMELSEIIINKSFVKEKLRYRIEPPNDPDSYCEKNWMPILDMPFHFVKWTNPTEVVKVNLKTRTSKTIFISGNVISNLPDLRGSSQVIKYKDFRICLVHDCNLFHNKMGQKDATYLHRFIIWDKDWNIVKISDAFSFMDGEIEFCCGMYFYKNDLLITFGFQDNAAFILQVPKQIIDNMIYE